MTAENAQTYHAAVAAGFAPRLNADGEITASECDRVVAKYTASVRRAAATAIAAHASVATAGPELTVHTAAAAMLGHGLAAPSCRLAGVATLAALITRQPSAFRCCSPAAVAEALDVAD